MLVLEAKLDEQIILYDTESDLRIVIKPFRRFGGGTIQLGFDAPERIQITRERGNGNGYTKTSQVS